MVCIRQNRWPRPHFQCTQNTLRTIANLRWPFFNAHVRSQVACKISIMWHRTALSWHWSCRAASTQTLANYHWNGHRTNEVSSNTWNWLIWASRVSSPTRTAIRWKTSKSLSMASSGNQFAPLLAANFGDYYYRDNIECKQSVLGEFYL